MNTAIAWNQQAHTTIVVSNLADDTSEEDIRSLFEKYGAVSTARLIRGVPNRRADGCCYLEMRVRPAKAAISAINGKAFKGSVLHVSEAHVQPNGLGEPRQSVADEQPRRLTRLRYKVASVEKAKMPAGTEGDDWYRYVLSCGSSQITGFHRGSRAEVQEYASHCVEEFNLRSISGKSARTMAPPKKKQP